MESGKNCKSPIKRHRNSKDRESSVPKEKMKKGQGIRAETTRMNHVENTNTNKSDDSRKILLTYPPNSSICVVSLLARDIETLNPRQLLNDQVVDFWMQYLYREKLTASQQSRTHVFSSYFFPSLQMSAASNRSQHQASMLRNWMKNVNIFTKDFLFVPISLRAHWFLAVICFPYLNLSDENLASLHMGSTSRITSSREVEEDTGRDSYDGIVKKPCILIFDSMKKYTREHTLVFRTLWTFLTTEYRRQMDSSVLNFTAATMPACVVEVPQQTNKCDCGLFVFKYFETFFSSPLPSFEFPIPSMKKWFSRKELASSRENIYARILILTQTYYPDSLPFVPTLVYCDKMMSDDESSESYGCS